MYWPARAPTIDSLLVARIPRASSIVLAGAHLILLVLGLLAAIPTIASIANLIALLPRAGDRGGRGRCRPRKVCLHLRLAQLGQLVPRTAAGSIAILGIRLLVLDDGLAFLDGRVLAASGPVEDTKTPGGRLEYAYMYRFQLPCRIHARTNMPSHMYVSQAHVPLASRRQSEQDAMRGDDAIGHGLAKVLALVAGGKALLLPLLDVIVDPVVANVDEVGALGILILADGLAADVRLEPLDVVGQALVGSLGPEPGGLVVAVVVGGNLEVALLLVGIAGRRNGGQHRHQRDDDNGAGRKLHALLCCSWRRGPCN